MQRESSRSVMVRDKSPRGFRVKKSSMDQSFTVDKKNSTFTAGVHF